MDKLSQKNKSRAIQQLEQLLKLEKSPQIENVLELSFSTISDDTLPIIISHINSLLTISSSRSKGLTLLNSILSYCSPELVLENATTWTNVCINHSPKKPIDVLNFKIMKKIMEICHGIQEFDKWMIASLSKVIDMCISVKIHTINTESALECLKVCLQKYPSPCGPFKNRVESYLCKFFTSRLPLSTVKIAGSCFHALQQVGGSGPNGITHVTNWKNQFNKLCVTLHKLYDVFYENVTEFSTFEVNSIAPFEIPQLSANNSNNGLGLTGSNASHTIANVLKNFVVFTNSMLLERFPVEKSVSVPQILDVIKRTLSVDVYQQCNEFIETTQFALLLYAHQIDVLYLLRSLIACFKQELMPFSFRITKILTDCLQRMQKDYFKNDYEYQKAVYKTLSYWIVTAKNKLNHNMHNKLVCHIVTKICPLKNSVTLCLSDNLSQKQSAKAKKKAIQDVIISKSVGTVEGDPLKLLAVKEVVCQEALNTLNTLLQNVVLELDRDVYQLLLETVTKLIMNIQGGKVMHPYTNVKCQAGLYKLLVSMFEQPDYCMTPILQIGINLFVKGQNRSNDIFLICSQGLNMLEKLCQGTCPTLCINEDIGGVNLTNFKRKKPGYEVEKRLSETILTEVEITDDPCSETQTGKTSDDTFFSTVSQISPTSSIASKKVKIINVQIIKQANGDEDNNTDQAERKEIANEKTDMNTVEEEDVIVKTEADSFVEVTVTAKEEDDLIRVQELPQSDDHKLLSNHGDRQVLTDTAVVKEPPLKRSRSMIEDEEAMLDSFIDVVHDY